MSKSDTALALVNVPEKVKDLLKRFFQSLGRDIPDINDDTDLIQGTGASSDEGVDFAIDLSDALGVEVPYDFNPFVHDSGRRGRRFGELVKRSKEFVSAAKENAHGG
jgi:acyl carrier protein